MPFWVAYVTLCVVFAIAGRRTKHAVDALLIVAGVLSMRLTNQASFEMTMFGNPIDTVGFLSFWVWVVVTATVARRRSHLTAWLLGISAIAYIPFIVSNTQITHLGVAAIMSDIPLILAILVCGNGNFGNPIGAYFTGRRYRVSPLDHGTDFPEGVARVSENHRESGMNGG